MPRRRAKDQDPVRKRSRNGCDRCRSRKVRCDEAKPTCGQCSAKNYVCQTTVHLKWETDYQSLGRAFGRAGVWSKRAPTSDSPPSPPSSHITSGGDIPWREIPHISAYSFVNATLGNVKDLTTLEYDYNDGLTGSTLVLKSAAHERDDTASTASISPWLHKQQLPGSYTAIPNVLRQLPHLSDPMHSHLLSYYMDRICPLTVPTSVSKSPFASLILPFSVTASPTVLDSLLALAACHRSKTDNSFKPTALLLGDKVLRTLRARLTIEDPRQVAVDTETLVVMMVLCQFEIVNECDKRWTVHLKGARDLIRLRREALAHWDQKPQANDLVDFLEKYFAYQDVIGRTACGEAAIFGNDFWDADTNQADAWLGCSPKLVATIGDITTLGRVHALNPAVSARPDFQHDAAAIETRLASLEQRVFDEDDDLLQTSAELKRLAAIVYFHSSVHSATPAMPLIKETVQQILQLVYVLLSHEVTAGLTWPVFIAAVELDTFADFEWISADEVTHDVPQYARPFILYALDKMSVSIANISRTRSVIEKVWHAREHGTVTAHGTMGRPSSASNDWERFVAPYCANMSLV
ncbi:hypothetical protein AAFC00_007336 [Neodothiora populina]|uniref:Zn(2)-C6 fungal-type domain-containing protein n=1 Tax=Neodothiora populina TaxID=2781224 RepID=A0ABR3PHY2_9PEZI